MMHKSRVQVTKTSGKQVRWGPILIDHERLANVQFRFSPLMTVCWAHSISSGARG